MNGTYNALPASFYSICKKKPPGVLVPSGNFFQDNGLKSFYKFFFKEVKVKLWIKNVL